MKYLILDPLPDDSCHFIAIEFYNRVGDLYLLEGGESSLTDEF